MQETFFPRPPIHVTQTLDILRQFSIAHKNLALHKDSISIFDVVQIFEKVGILTQENYDALLMVEDTNSVAQSIRLLGSENFLCREVFCAAIKHQDHKRCAAILEDLHKQDNLTCGSVAVVVSNQELTKRSALSCLLG